MDEFLLSIGNSNDFPPMYGGFTIVSPSFPIDGG